VALAATNIDPVNHWAWNDKVGWIDFSITGNVNVYSSRLEGYADSSLGYIALNCNSTPNGNICATSNFKVTNDGSGFLSGWAWNDKVGWISFDCHVTSDNCATSVYQVSIDALGNFLGYAWNDTIGWISFNCVNVPSSCSSSNYKVVTSWRAALISASLLSSIFDTNSSSTLNSVTWNGGLPSGTVVKFQFASANSSAGPWIYRGPDGSGLTFYTPVGPNVSVGINRAYHNNYRYFRYMITLVSDTLQENSPSVDDIFVNWSP
jgi:hypothetical protein